MKSAMKLLASLLACASLSVTAQPTPPLPDLIWPLCGRLGEQPGSWQPGDPCPHTTPDPARHDLPIHNGYGLRTFVVSSRPVSFHRGIDLATRAASLVDGLPGNPVFAVCNGVIKRILGTDPVDLTLELVCPETGAVAADATVNTACVDGNPCFTAAYRHVQALRVIEQQVVALGAHLGYTGSTNPGGNEFKHLHFEFLDPRLRQSNTTHGRTAFSKDSINPLRYLPSNFAADVTVAATIDDSGVFDDYADGKPALVLALQAQPGFAHDFAEVDIEIHVPTSGGRWKLQRKALADIAAATDLPTLSEPSATLGVAYPIADGHAFVSSHAPERISRFYTPFSEGSSLWTAEKGLTWFRILFDSVYPGVDGLLERNAASRLTDGHLTHDFDFRLIRPYPNPAQSIEDPADPASWWGLLIGLREFGPSLGDIFCVRTVIRMLPADGNPRSREHWLPMPEELDCTAAAAARAQFRDGFEADGG